MYLSIRNMHFSMDAMEAIREAQMQSIPSAAAGDQPSYYWQIYRKSKTKKDTWVFVTDFQGTETELNEFVSKWYPQLETKVKRGIEFPKKGQEQ